MVMLRIIGAIPPPHAFMVCTRTVLLFPLLRHRLCYVVQKSEWLRLDLRIWIPNAYTDCLDRLWDCACLHPVRDDNYDEAGEDEECYGVNENISSAKFNDKSTAENFQRRWTIKERIWSIGGMILTGEN